MRLVAVDLETKCNVPECTSGSCDHALRPETGRITVIGAYDGNEFKHWTDPAAFGESLLKEYADASLVGQNFVFDIRFLVAAVPALQMPLLRQWFGDTQILAHVLTDKIPDAWLEDYEKLRKEENKKLPHGYSHRAASKHSLKTLAPYFLGVEAFWEDPTNHESLEYLAKDCEYTYRLYQELAKRAKELDQFEFYQDFSMPVAKMLARASLKGIELDQQALREVAEESENAMLAAEAKLNQLWAPAIKAYYDLEVQALRDKYDAMLMKQLSKAKDKTACQVKYEGLFQKAKAKLEPGINYSSPNQMTWLLRDYLGYDIVDAEGDETTGKSVLNRLASEGHEDVKTYLEWKKHYKILTMYIPTYQALVAADGAIHANFNITGTRTGRLSSSAPNMQQLPKSLYRLFKPRDGYKFITYDYGAIEAVLIALYSEDPTMYDIVTKDLSIHDYNTKYAVFPERVACEVDAVKHQYPAERRIGKTLGFAVLYGAGQRRVQASLATAGNPVSAVEAKTILGRLKTLYKEVFSFHREMTDTFERGEVVHNLIGRPLAVENPEDAYMKGFNTLVQSSASDLLLLAALRATKRFGQEGLDAYPLLFVHDALVVEVKAEDAQAADAIIQQSLTGFKFENSLGTVPLSIDGGISNKWE